MIVDIHAHLTPDGSWFGSGLDASPETLLQQMDEADVDKAVIIPIPGCHDNEFMLRTAKQYDDRFIPAVTVDPAPDAVEKLKDLFERGARVIKIHPKRQKLSSPGMPELLDIYGFAESNGVPVLMDTFNLPSGVMRNWTPLQYDPILHEYPNLKMIFAHSGAFHVLELMELMRAHQSIFTDLSLITTYFPAYTSVWNDLRFFVNRFKGDRFLWGSDFPEVTLQGSRDAASRLMGELMESNKKRVFGENAVTLLQLSDG